MNNNIKLKWLLALLCVFFIRGPLFAQSQVDVFDTKVPVTWLGLDYTQAKYIYTNNESKDATDSTFKYKYVPAWNYLFMIQGKKFDVAKSIHRASVDNEISVTEKANKAISKVFTKDQKVFKTLTDQNISDLVKNYDFQGKTGVGMLFFVEGMSKLDDEEGVWVTFVDMSSKTMLSTTYMTGKVGGMGFRNNWADANYQVLRQLEADKRWHN